MTKFLLPIFLLISPSLFGQVLETEWFSDDAQWVIDHPVWGPGFDSVTKIVVRGDTLIADKPCKILSEVSRRDTGNAYLPYGIVYEENYQVFEWRPDGSFLKIYDFLLEIGEELILPNYISECDVAAFQLVEFGWEEFENYQVPYQIFYPYCKDNQQPLLRRDDKLTKVYYGVGSVENRTGVGYFGPLFGQTFLPVIADPASRFNCYCDEKISYSEEKSFCSTFKDSAPKSNMPIKGIVFWDRNNNGVLDSLESGIPNVPIKLTKFFYFQDDIEFSTFTNQAGHFQLNPYVESNRILVNEIFNGNRNCWQATTDIFEYIYVDTINLAPINFGYSLTASDLQQTKTRIAAAPTRCGFTVPYTLSVENNGCQPTNGQYGIVLSTLTQFIEANRPPDEIRGDTLLWEYEPLISNQITQVKVLLEMAGPDFIGDTVQLTGLAYIEDAFGNQTLNSTYDYRSEIRCAYDPNDKLVAPNRLNEFDQNYTLFEEALEYTIRFQNTGNDTAFNVVLEDQLDKNLDWATFQPILASHPYEVVLQKAGLLKFSFPNILLPDSTINEPASHGFISYKIKTLDSLSENTLIENSANIFFDFNPPILTNTVQNVMVEALPKTTNTKHLSFDNQLVVFPNPFDNWLSFQWKGNAVLPIKKIRLFDATGKIVQEWNDSAITRVISINFLPNGIYFYQVLGAQGQLIGSDKIIKY